MSQTVDIDRLLTLRLVVARFGEMDLARWWNTNGQLGNLGVTVLRRGFPRTHRFAQARAVFAVAGHRCEEIFNPPGSVTLWRLPASLEDEFEARWEHWLDEATVWDSFFKQLENLGERGPDLASVLRSLELVTDRDLEQYARLRRSAEGRVVALPGVFSGEDEDVRMLALGFGRGEPGAPVVPYARSADA